ncbi:MAG: hypothetical protein IKN04_14935 [Clostridia bacterium]|nr:hypothetical protein [Clostridia bacterium]
MKEKFTIYREDGFDEATQQTKYAVLKTMKRAPDALAYINDLKNIREYGYLRLEKRGEDGATYLYNDSPEGWELLSD